MFFLCLVQSNGHSCVLQSSVLHLYSYQNPMFFLFLRFFIPYILSEFYVFPIPPFFHSCDSKGPQGSSRMHDFENTNKKSAWV